MVKEKEEIGLGRYVIGGTEGNLVAFLPGRLRLIINEGLRIETFPRLPNWWFRLWQYLLLGWRWEKINEGE